MCIMPESVRDTLEHALFVMDMEEGGFDVVDARVEEAREWLATLPEMPRADWDRHPGYNYYACHPHFETYFTHKPKMRDKPTEIPMWLGGGSSHTYMRTLPPGIDWRLTLQKRPNDV